jgi:hypothetical protein
MPRLPGALHGLLGLSVLLGACATSAPRLRPLEIEPSGFAFDDNPQLLARLRSGPHGYLRFVNVRFANEVCRRLAHLLPSTPSVNLHGDVHVEQYAVTSLGRGLTDFDDSSTGPPMLDLVRFGTSLRLAADQLGWAEDGDRIVARFYEGYRAALVDPELEPAPPPLVGRVAADFSADRARFHALVDEVASPVAPIEETRVRAAMRDYVDAMGADRPELGPRYFEVRSVRHPRTGIGSALDRKYLVRVRGPSDAEDDDEIIELKAVRDLVGIGCIEQRTKTEPFRILVAQSRIAYAPDALLGYLRIEGHYFWVHAWTPNYTELDVSQSFASPDELGDVAWDVGVQLGKGHPKLIAAPHDGPLRRELVRLLDAERAHFDRLERELADELRAAWQRFRDATGP